MQNNLILIGEIIITFGLVTLVAKFFGEVGLTAWVCIASILANIITAKNGMVFGLSTALGTVMFASTFLATDILCERYGAKSARRAVIMGILSTLVMVISTQIVLLYVPSPFDYAHESMSVLFGLNLRISGASMLMYAIANFADVILFERLRKATGGKALWLRNNVSTILCNCLENFGFIFLAFYGVYDAKQCVEIAISTSIIEMIVAICDTPFAYIAIKNRINRTS